MDADLIIDPPAPGPWNMALDEALRERAAACQRPVVRFYQWSPATLSLGYFQSCADRHQHAVSRTLPLVRRASGGGAIVHDQELTYSCALPVRTRFSTAAKALVTVFHQSLCDTLRDWGIMAHPCEPADSTRRELEPFLCFQRRAEGDVLLEGEKIAGSAQRRLQGSVLQHGSVLLSTSHFAPELPGIAQLSGRSMAIGEVRDAWRSRLSEVLPALWNPLQLEDEWREQAAAWLQNRFATSRWNERR